MNPRALKILVAVMTALLIVGIAVLAIGIANKLAQRPTPPPAAAFDAPPITLPRGASIERMSTSADRIVLEILLSDGSAELVEIDLATGRLLGIIPLKEAP